MPEEPCQCGNCLECVPVGGKIRVRGGALLPVVALDFRGMEFGQMEDLFERGAGEKDIARKRENHRRWKEKQKLKQQQQAA